jgi:colanic acid/amylovoran biosynthesis glycosyltransferase
MKIFVIQPNLSAKSEVWLFRINLILEKSICGVAAFLTKEEANNNTSVFNLNGRNPNFFERQLIRLKLLKYNFDTVMRKELLGCIKRSNANMIIVHYATTAHYLWNGILENLKIPVFIYVHGHDVIWDHRDLTGDKLHSETYIKNIFTISKNSNVKFIANSLCTYKNLVTVGIDENKIVLKYFGVDLPKINRDYDKDELQVLFLGRFVDFKGPEIVLSAYIKACDLGFKGTLIMAGDGPLKIMCEIIARRSEYADRISFTGAVTKEKAEELYRSSDLYTMHNSKGIISNGYDTFGVTFIEAMSYGLPVVTAPIGGPAEIIEDGVDGILVQENDVDEHAQAFMQLYNCSILRQKLGENGRRKVETKFSSIIEKKELLRILETLFKH